MTKTTGFSEEMAQRLGRIRDQGLYRELRRVDSPQSPLLEMNGQPVLNFSSNDYLGLANDPRLKEAAIRALEKFGVGAGAARLVCGSLAPHHELEAALAAFKGTEAALTFTSGYAAALGTICALLEKEDVVILDKRDHACLVDAARLSGATLRIYAHNDLNDLEHILKWADRRRAKLSAEPSPHTLIVTESVFSMDGDHAPLDQLVELKERYGAWLMVDEAHATGLYGSRRRGLSEVFGMSDRIEIQMSTLGKALGTAGGFICGSRALIDYLVNRARSFIFSTAPVPAVAAAATAALQIVQSRDGETRCQRLWQRVAQWDEAGLAKRAETHLLPAKGRPDPKRRSAIVPLVIGDAAKAVEIAADLRARGLFIPAIRYPSVPRGQARLRVTLTASHTADEVSRALTAISHLKFQI